MSTQSQNRDKEQAEIQLESITAMMKRLHHCNECEEDEPCKLTDKEIYEGLNLYYKEGNKATEEERKQYHNRDDAEQQIQEDPLSAEIVKTYEILLCTGGPACRIIGELDEHNQPETARLQYQDWFKPWTDLEISQEQEKILLNYARQFYFES